MRKAHIVIGIFVMAVLVVGSNKSFAGQLGSELKLQQEGPTLEETMKWIKIKLEGYRLVYLADGNDQRSVYFDVASDGCSLEFSWQLFDDPPEKFRVDFRRVKGVTLREDTHGKPIIYDIKIDHAPYVYPICFTDKNLADRMFKALNHAHELCRDDKGVKEVF